ncbi:MAG: peptide chain release factor 1 [Gemmatimonadota bacterium]
MSADPTTLAAPIRSAIERHAELNRRMADPNVLEDHDLLRRLAQEHSDLGPLVEAGKRFLRVLEEREDAEGLVRSERGEMAEMARAEVGRLDAEAEAMVDGLRRLLVPRDPLEDRPAVVEIRAGTGGDEAALFAADLFRMYSRYADGQGWSIDIASTSEGVLNGLKEVIFTVSGRDAYGRLRYESGVHRVQRVPVTESSGRIHTSAASVAVLPEAEDVDVEIDPGDLKIDVYRSSGPGGQSVNTTDSAVRITHKPTGLVVTCQDEKSQHKNKAKALKVLRSRLLDRRIAAQEAERARERRLQVGTGDRSAKIRTYNFPQNRLTDHRINLTLHRLETVLDGDLDEVIEALRTAGMEERLEAQT